ncbi:MAG: alpha-mannosidase [Anaerolineales bacterium]|nr:alpha-mannosidase [Anaerolineales bacterium]
MDISEQLNRISQAVQAKIVAIRGAGRIPQWRTAFNAPAGAEAPGFSDDQWETVKLSHNWSALDGEKWFRATVPLPENVEGVDLTGTGLEFDVFLALGATVYADGKEVRTDQWWTDTRAVPLPLTDDYRPGPPLTLAVRCDPGDGFGLFIQGSLRFERLEQLIFDLDLVRTQLTFTAFLAQKENDPALLQGWQQAAEALDLPALAGNDWERWTASVTAARSALEPFASLAKRYMVHLIAHSHIDMNWLWPWKDTVEVCRRDFTTMDALMEEFEEFRFSQSQASVYEATETHFPELFERIRNRVAEGRWDVTASTWVEGDLNMAAGETIARHLLHTRRYMLQRFGIEPLICWEPDTFGHIATMPQFLRKSGIRYYYFCRAGRNYPLFWWEGLDGSRVLAVQDPKGYNGVITPSEVGESLAIFAKPYDITCGLFLYGAGDHGGAATRRDIEAARAIDAAPFVPHARPSTTSAFYQQALAEAQDLPVVRGEMNTVFEGCYTSHGDIKRLNRDGENALLTAEAAATLAAIVAGAPYPADVLAQAWRTVCFHQFHDILCGCAIGVAYREAAERMGEALDAARRTTASALQTIAEATHPVGEPGPVVTVFNPLAWERDDVVRVPLAQLGDRAPQALVDEAGRRLPVQVSGDELVFVAEQLPALGVRVYRPTDELADGPCACMADPERRVIENGLLRLRVHAASGALDGLVDLETGRDLVGPYFGWSADNKGHAGQINRMQILWEQPHSMSAWNIGDITRVEHLVSGAEVRVVEQGPVRAAIEVRRRFLNSNLVQRIVLYRRLRRIDFETEIDWHERGSAHADAPMLRVTFAPFLGQTRATFEVPFAGLERPADGREVPALRWSDISEIENGPSDGRYGVSLLNDGKYGHQAHGNTLGLTLVRASYEPDNNPDEGLHHFTYSLYPHVGDWQQAGTVRQATQLNQPVAVAVSSGGTGRLPTALTGLRCEPDSVVVSALKLAEDQPDQGRALIVRVYEPIGSAAKALLRLAWPVARAEEVDLIERRIADLPVGAEGIALQMEPYEFKTVKLYLG